MGAAQLPLFDRKAAEQGKAQGIALADGSVRAWPWKAHALQVIEDLAETGVPFTADDVIAKVGLPSEGPNRNNAVGAVFSGAARRGIIVPTGHYRKSRRVAGHARAVAVWTGNPDWLP